MSVTVLFTKWLPFGTLGKFDYCGKPFKVSRFPGMSNSARRRQ